MESSQTPPRGMGIDELLPLFDLKDVSARALLDVEIHYLGRVRLRQMFTDPDAALFLAVREERNRRGRRSVR